MSGRYLGGVLGCLSDSGYCLGWVGWGRGVRCEIESNFDQLVTSLPGASDCLKVVWKVS